MCRVVSAVAASVSAVAVSEVAAREELGAELFLPASRRIADLRS